MKAYKYLSLGAAALLFAACQSDSDFLEEKPKDKVTTQNAFDNSDQLLATVLAAYTQYESFFFAQGMGSDNFTYRAAGTDILDCKVSNTHYSDFKKNWMTTSGFVKSMWDGYYKMISYANLAISQIDNVTWNNPGDKARLEAEAHFLRGIAHLRLAEYYGDVPMVKEYVETLKVDYKRDSRADVYRYAIDEFKMAYEALPEFTVKDGEPGRASKYAAALYLAEAYLALGVEANESSAFLEAEKYAKQVTEKHPLVTERFGMRAPGAPGDRNGIKNEFLAGTPYTDLFVSQNMINPANTEAIWIAMAAPDYRTHAANGSQGNRSITLSLSPALQDYGGLKGDVAGNSYGKPFSENVAAKYGGEASPYIHGGTGWAQNTITWDATYDVWNQRNFGTEHDYRYDEGVSVRTKYLVTNEKHPMFEKYVGWEEISGYDGISENELSMFGAIFYKETPMDQWDWDTENTGWPWFFFVPKACLYRNKYIARSADAYLLLAEAYYRQGKPDDALRELNKVRARAHANDATSIDIQVILDERERELLLEEDRWATLLRNKPEEWQKRIMDYATYTASGSAKKYPEVRRWSEFQGPIQFKNWPIPQTYIDLNTGAEFPQNPGW